MTSETLISLNDEKPTQITNMERFYNSMGRGYGFLDVWTSETYIKASKLSSGRYWTKWFDEARKENSVRYTTSISIFAEDGAKRMECDLVAFDLDDNEVSRGKLCSGYSGYHDDYDVKTEEFMNSIKISFKEIMNDMEEWKNFNK